MNSRPKTRVTADGRMEVWAPPKPRIGIQAIQRLLLRHVAIVCPESRLWAAVIALAMADSLSANDLQRRPARCFLTHSSDLAFWCHLIGIEVDFVREVAIKAGYLMDEDALWKPLKGPKTRRAARKKPEREAACA